MPVLDFQVPSMILYGNESLQRLPEYAAPNQEKVVIVTDKRATELGITPKVKRILEGYAYDIINFEIPSNATTKDLFEGVNIVKGARADVVVGIGSSNSLSVAKCIAQFSTQEVTEESLKGYKKLAIKKVKYVEVPYVQTINWGLMPITYVIDDTDKIRKPYSDRDSIATAIIIDPVLTEDVPLNDVVYSSLEALAYAFDSYISKKSNPISDSFSIKAIEYISVNLKRLAVEPANTKLKGNLSVGALLASLSTCFSSAGLTCACGMGIETSTGISSTIGTSILLPHIMEFNLTAAANRFIQIAMALGEKVTEVTVIEAAIMAIEAIRKLMLELHVPQRLSEYNFTEDKIDTASKVATQYEFLNYIPRPAGRSEINEILSAAM
ncbi:MAG: iron-containing alcohol dehydrogenase [Brevinematales bacterium]|nr:iron-containing alcohol dehydrogenase [Brevinematales bacterium]